MIEIRIHGRGGQGAVIASEVLATAVFREGKYVQSFPTFGVERRGAPVAAFTRIDDRPVRVRYAIYEPDHLMVLDSSLLEAVDVTAGLKKGGWIVINSDKEPSEIDLPKQFRVGTVDASGIAVKYGLGPINAPIVNTAILGAFSRITDLVGLEAVLESIAEYVPIKMENNVAAAREAYQRAKF